MIRLSVFLGLLGCLSLLRAAPSSKNCVSKLDVELILDSSGSVGEPNFEALKQHIVDDLLPQLNIGRNKGRLAVVTYSHVMKQEIDLDSEYETSNDLADAIRKIEYKSGGTMTADAMNKALDNFEPKMRADRDVLKICYVVTDGESNDRYEVPAAAARWKKAGVHVFAIGIGDGIDDQGLDDIAGGEHDRTFKVNNFGELSKATEEMTKEMCRAAEEEKVTTVTTVTPPPKEKCETKNYKIILKTGGFKSTCPNIKKLKKRRDKKRAKTPASATVILHGGCNSCTFNVPRNTLKKLDTESVPIAKKCKIGSLKSAEILFNDKKWQRNIWFGDYIKVIDGKKTIKKDICQWLGKNKDYKHGGWKPNEGLEWTDNVEITF